MSSIEELKSKIAAFSHDRDWDQFHSPKNLAMALSVEVAELVEHFQWLTEEQSGSLSKDAKEAVAEEIADIQIYLIRLADKLGVDILRSAELKLKKNELKYPAGKARGNAKKYTEFD